MMFIKKAVSRIQPKLVIELSQIGVGQFLATIGSLLGVSFLTKIMAPRIYGELGLCLTFLTLSQQLIFGPLGNAFARYFPVASESNELHSYFNSVKKNTVYGIIGLSFFFVTFIVLSLSIGNVSWLTLGLFTFLFTVVSSLNIILDSIQNAGRHRAIVAWHQCAGQWLKFAFALLLIYVFSPSSTFAMLGFFISAIFVLVSQYYFFRKQFTGLKISTQREDNSSNYWDRLMIGFSLPFSSWGIFTWAQMTSDRWALQTFGSLSDVGMYVVVYQLGFYPVVFLTNVFVQFISPILFKKVGSGEDDTRLLHVRGIVSKLVLLTFGFTVLISGFAWLLRNVIFGLLVSSEYQSVADLFPIMVLAGGFFATGQVCSLDAMNRGKPSSLIFPKIITAIVGIGLNIIGAIYWGIAGVVYSQVAFSCFFFIWVYIALIKNGVTIRKIIPQ